MSGGAEAGATPRLVIRRGQIVLVELDPAIGSEQGKVRPAVVVSNNAANDAASRTGRGVITVVPVTSNTRSLYPFQVLLQPEGTGLGIQSKAQAEQVRSISVTRAVRQLGWADAEILAQLDEALRVHLSL